MNIKSRIMTAAFATLLMSACSGGPKSMILGKWEVENAPLKMTAEFNRDGTAKLSMLGQTIQGTYKLNADRELEWTVNGITTKAKIEVTPSELELTDDAKRTIKYQRK